MCRNAKPLTTEFFRPITVRGKFKQWNCWCRDCYKIYSRSYHLAYRAREKSKADARDRYRKHSLTLNFKSALRRCLRGERKGFHKLELVDYSIDELRTHLERQFHSGMSWENYGRYWHIDHIIPVAHFDCRDPEQLKACWALHNLRPLKADEHGRTRHARTQLL